MYEGLGVKDAVVCQNLEVQTEPVFVLLNFFKGVFGIYSRSSFVPSITADFVLFCGLYPLKQPVVTLFF